MNKMVSIVLLNWNGKQILENCLNSIKKNTSYPNYEIILVDNGSEDSSVEMVKKNFPEVKIIKNPENYGIPKASNQGTKMAKGDYIIFMSNDTLATNWWMNGLVEAINKDKKISSVAATLIESKNYGKIKREAIEEEKESVCSATMIVTRKAWENVGEYDEENFTPYGGDETDWNYRARNMGYKVMKTRRAFVHHIGHHDTKKQNPNQYFLLHYNTWKAIFFNSSLKQFFKRLPGQGLLFLNSFKYGKTLTLLRVYLTILINLPSFLKYIKQRKLKVQEAKKQQQVQGINWF